MRHKMCEIYGRTDGRAMPVIRPEDGHIIGRSENSVRPSAIN